MRLEQYGALVLEDRVRIRARLFRPKGYEDTRDFYRFRARSESLSPSPRRTDRRETCNLEQSDDGDRHVARGNPTPSRPRGV